MAKWLMIIGLILMLVGAVWHFAPWTLSWFGKLPGDIRLGNARHSVLIPFTSMILISLVLNLILFLFRK